MSSPRRAAATRPLASPWRMRSRAAGWRATPAPSAPRSPPSPACWAGPGAHLLNLSYEWACTCGLRDDPLGAAGPQMLRVLDWDLPGLGETLCVVRQRGPAGEWLHIGWPGFAGAITALAPGRFAVAINQPPLPPTRLRAPARRRGAALAGLLSDWAAARSAAWRARALPPAHLLRLVCDAAPSYAAALRLRRATPVTAAAAFTLAGARPGEAPARPR